MLQDMQKDFEIKKIKRSACKMKEPHSHPFHELFYLAKGECTAFLSHNIYKFSKGDIVIVQLEPYIKLIIQEKVSTNVSL